MIYAAEVGLRDEIDRKLRTRGSLDGRAGAEYARNAEPVVEALADLVRSGRATDAVAFTARALAVVIEGLGADDDPEGAVGDLVRHLLDIHLDACRAGGQEPLSLARWLVQFGLDDQDWFAVDVDTYADPLGDAGLAAYRREVERRWSAGDRSFGVRRAKERLAFLGRDVDELVALLGGDLRMSRQYLHVAEAMRQLERYDDALSWALRGLTERPDRLVGKVYDFAVAEYLRRGATDDALALRRTQHAQQRTATSYFALRSVARAAGTWDEDGPRALALLEQAVIS